MLFLYISIHAPVKGATYLRQTPSGRYWHFNPRTREGCDVSSSSAISIDMSYFNPRTREGCDVFFPNMQTFSTISIHAPVKGATVVQLADQVNYLSFQSTHP